MQIDETECDTDLRLNETYSSSTLSPSQSTTTEERKVLGVIWNTRTDELLVRLDIIPSGATGLEPTKRAKENKKISNEIKGM